jgi:hypothetical protein
MWKLIPILSACAVAAVSVSLGAPPNDAVVTFNEIHFNPAGTGEAGEFVEVTNVMSTRVDLSGWRISGGIDFVFPNNKVIEPGASLVIAKTPASYSGAIGPFTGSLENSGETLRLRDRNDRIMDEVTYGDSGDWPVAPDGGGASLAKRSPFLNSSEAGSWAPSPQLNGSPGAANFPPPPGPVTTRFVGRQDTWKFNTSGSVPVDWKNVGFNDTAWSSGPAGLQFGNPALYSDPLPSVAEGHWFVKPWSGDGDSEISNVKTYTHKVGLNRGGAYSPINGVTFDSPGSNSRVGPNWILTGAPNVYVNNGNGQGANNLPIGSGSRQLCEEFFYGASNALATSRLQLGGLSAGQTYIATFYATGFGGPATRQVRITPSDTGISYLVDENVTNSGNGVLVKYRYVAPASGSVNFDFQDTSNATWHHYAFSNEVAPAPFVPQTEITATTVAGFSSELNNGGFTRAAVHTVNGTGLTNRQHGVAPEGTMWLSNGTFGIGTDPLPAEITFDLGAVVDLAGFHVWNYNEATNGLMTRGANQVIVQTAPTVGGTFTTQTTLNFRKAFGVVSEPGQRFDLSVLSARQVRFIIQSSHGGDNNFAGLSEVRFFRQGFPPPGPPIPLRETISSLRNTGAGANGGVATPGSSDLAWTNVATGVPAIVMAGHPAWSGFDGLSMWIGSTANGTDNVPPVQSTYRTAFDLTNYDAAQATIQFLVGADNSLDNVTVNGVAKGITATGFNPMLGPFTIPGPFNAGSNTLDFIWSNAPPNDNPAALRVAWNATAPPLLARSALPANPVTTYFRRSFNHTGNPASSYRLMLDFIADDGAIFYLNGTELHRENLPVGGIDNNTPASSAITFPKFHGVFEVPAGALLPGQPNVLAVELHQVATGDADAFFLATLDVEETAPPVLVPTVRFNEITSAQAGTFFVEIQNTGANPLSLAGYQVRSSSDQTYIFGAVNLASGGLLSLNQTTLGFRPLDGDKLFLITSANVTADGVIVKNSAQARSADGHWLVPNSATPGTANTFTLNTSIVINEIMYHHAPDFLPTGTIASSEEWVELYNRSGGTVLLTGWKLRGGMDYDFPAGTQIAANSYLVVAKDPAALLVKFSGITVIGPANGSLSNQADTVRLEDAVGNSVNEVSYFDGGRWDGRADGGGSSLELRNPGIDNSVPEAWAASDESAKATWTNISYSGSGASFPGTNDPAGFHEFILGLINAGECLVDDVSVLEQTAGNRQLIQNGTFATTTSWRNLGNHGLHGRTVVVPDPAAPGNSVMKIVATGPTEHMHNHCETTFANGITTNSGATYAISFRARWVSGSPRLQSRLYFNRLTQQHILPVPANLGTPGAQNSRFTALAGPTFSGLTQNPVLPQANEPVTLRVAVKDPQGVVSVAIKYRLDGVLAWSTAPMALVNGAYEGLLPAHPSGSLVQFYLEASDGTTLSTYPAAGPSSRAFVRWKDFITPATAAHGLRILMATADSDILHFPPNVMSNEYLPCTVVYRESEVFYDAKVRLKSSERGRDADIRLGFALEFDPTHKFRGAHTNINIDRSGYGRGTTGNGYGHSEIVTWHMFNRAGGIPSMYNDMIYLIAPRSVHTGSGILTMAEFNDVWADSQYEGGASYPTFKYELIYFPTTTTGTPEGLKLPQPDGVQGVEFGSITSPDKEAFRWNFLIGNARDEDDFRRLINLSDTFRLTGGAFANAVGNALDVDQWLRASAALSLAGIQDNYSTTAGAWHNLKLYHRADGRILYLPWDLDFQTQGFNAALIINPDISALTGLGAAQQRLFYQHLQDIIRTSFNRAYLEPWVNHYSSLNASGGNWAEILTYVDQRGAYVQSQIDATYPLIPFDITTPDFSTNASSAVLDGNGWIDVRTITAQVGGIAIPVIWTSGNTWQLTIPVAPGVNVITLRAYDYQGNLVGTDTITITGTGTVIPAAVGSLAFSEIHYNPAAPTGAELDASADKDEFEFIEIQNIHASANVSLTGCHLGGGLDYAFPDITLAPGERAVIPRNYNAFNARYPTVAPLDEYYQAGANFLSNSGETITLLANNGSEITRATYGDNSSVKWPPTPDGGGPSLVLIAPATNPDATNPLHWRASTALHGNPGTGDAFALPAFPLNDDNKNGLNNLVDYSLGAGLLPKAGSVITLGLPRLTFTIERNPLADARWKLERASTPAGPWTAADADYEISARVVLPNGVERLTLRALAPLTGPSGLLRARLRTP